MAKYVLIGLLLFCFSARAQEEIKPKGTWELQYYRGIFIRHNKDVAHLVRAHPRGGILSYNRPTFGEKYWQQGYGYPDWGFSFVFQDFNNPEIGSNYALLGHYNFYFFRRQLQFKIGQGVAYNTNPFNLDTNFKNVAHSTRFTASTLISLSYQKKNIFKGIGFQTGFNFLHHSNGSLKSPNTGSNVASFFIGLNYNVDDNNHFEYKRVVVDSLKYSKKLTYNLLLSSGINEADVVGIGQKPFLVTTAFVSKRVSYKSTFQAGVEAFFSQSLKQEIKYTAISFPRRGFSGNEDYKRVGLFLGYELRLNKLALMQQLGYYVYWPFPFEERVYNRTGLKRYFAKDRFFGTVSLKSHFAKAEAIEFGVGVQL